MAGQGSAAKLALVTGCSAGIGRALAQHMSEAGIRVLAVARRAAVLAEIATESGAGIVPVAADVSTTEGRSKILHAVEESGSKLSFVVHNAAVVGPVGVDLKDVDESAFRSMMEINAFAPLFLTQALLPHMATPGARVLHISSGAAHRPLGGANPYCTSKATLFFLYRALKSEFEVEKDADGKQLVLIGSARPGVVDTGMQVSLRGQDQDKYPFAAALAQKYDAMDRTVAADATAKPPPSDALDTATNAGHFLTWLLTGTTDEEFGGEEWDIRETSHHGRWCKEGTSASGS